VRHIALGPVDRELLAHFFVEEHFFSIERNGGSLDETGERLQNARFAESFGDTDAGDAGRLKRSGRQRPEFQRILDQIRPGDVIVVWKLDRLARSTRDLLNTMDTVNEAGGKFQFISEPWANIP